MQNFTSPGPLRHQTRQWPLAKGLCLPQIPYTNVNTNVRMRSSRSARLLLVVAASLALLPYGKAFSIRHQFRTNSANPLRFRDLISFSNPSIGKNGGWHSSDAPEDFSSSGAEEQRHQLNGVVTLTGGEYGFTYRPIASAIPNCNLTHALACSCFCMASGHAFVCSPPGRQACRCLT